MAFVDIFLPCGVIRQHKDSPSVKRAIQKRRPFVFLNVATTADGKLAPASRQFVPFGSRRDREMMFALRARADAVMTGAVTVETAHTTLGPGGSKYRRQRIRRGLNEFNVRVIVSGSASIDPDSPIFKQHDSPLVILTTGRAPARKVAQLRARGAAVEICGKTNLDFRRALELLWEKYGVRTLLCEGGGEVNGALFEAGLVDEIYLTLCPVIFGGRDAPTLADGKGIGRLADAVKLKIKSMKRVGDELFLVFRVVR